MPLIFKIHDSYCLSNILRTESWFLIWLEITPMLMWLCKYSYISVMGNENNLESLGVPHLPLSGKHSGFNRVEPLWNLKFNMTSLFLRIIPVWKTLCTRCFSMLSLCFNLPWFHDTDWYAPFWARNVSLPLVCQLTWNSFSHTIVRLSQAAILEYADCTLKLCILRVVVVVVVFSIRLSTYISYWTFKYRDSVRFSLKFLRNEIF